MKRVNQLNRSRPKMMIKSILHKGSVFVFIIVVSKCLSPKGIMQMRNESHPSPFVQTVLCFKLRTDLPRCCRNELIYGMLFYKQFDGSVNIYVSSKRYSLLMCHLDRLWLIFKIHILVMC